MYLALYEKIHYLEFDSNKYLAVWMFVNRERLPKKIFSWTFCHGFSEWTQLWTDYGENILEKSYITHNLLTSFIQPKIEKQMTNFSFAALFSYRHFGYIIQSIEEFNKPIVLFAFVWYEMILTNSVLPALLVIYHLVSKVDSWNNC